MKKIIIAKDTAGVATDYKINISLEFIILSENNIKVTYSDSINIKNNSENLNKLSMKERLRKILHRC